MDLRGDCDAHYVLLVYVDFEEEIMPGEHETPGMLVLLG
jgi:hypothetical protein